MAPPRRLRVLTRQLCATTGASEDQGSRLDELLAIRAKLDVAIEGLQGGAEATAAPDDGMVLRPLEPSDFPAVSALNANVFAKPYPDRVHDWLSSIPPESWDTLCAFAPDGQLACSFWCRHYTMQANGRALPLAGIAGVGTHTDHRRKGLLRRIMTEQFQTMRARGQSCAALWASQAAIYQRYGFSMVTTSRGYTVDTVDVGFADGDAGSTAVTQLPADDPATPAALQAMYETFTANRVGYLQRDAVTPPTWGLDESTQRAAVMAPMGAGLRGVLGPAEAEGPVYVATAGSRGYAVYTLSPAGGAPGVDGAEHRTRPQQLKLRELVWHDIDAYRSL